MRTRVQDTVKRLAMLLLASAFVPGAFAVANRRTPIVEAVEKAIPSVVNIGTERYVKIHYNDPRRRLRGDLFDQVLRDFFGAPVPPGYEVKPSLGSGIIIDPKGYILTNFHVIERASAIRVTLADETEYIGHVLATDEINDLALLKVDNTEPLQAVEFAEDDDLLLGETVIVLGNPFGLAHSVSVGVLSSKNREARYQGEVLYRDILQTDAAVNPGNSGGPLLNVEGDLIGINVAIYPDAQNIGFAVPVKRARALLARWLSPRLLTKTWLGMELKPGKDERLEVVKIDEGGPADQAGVKVGDLLRSVNGRDARTVYAYHKALLPAYAGTSVPLIFRRAGEDVLTEVLVADLPKPSGKSLARDLLGLRFGKLSETQAARLKFKNGLPIERVYEGGPAAPAGLRPGLLVTRINDVEIRSLEDVGVALENVGHNTPVSVVLVSVMESGKFIMAQSTAVQLMTQ